MDGRKRKRNAGDGHSQQRASPDSDESSFGEPSYQKARTNPARRPPAGCAPIEVIEILDSSDDESEEDEHEIVQQVEPADTTRSSRNASDNDTSLSSKAKDTLDRITDPALAYKEKENRPPLHNNGADTADTEKERMESEVADGVLENRLDSDISVMRHEIQSVGPAKTGTARSLNNQDADESSIDDPALPHNDKENDICLAEIHENDTDTFLADDEDNHAHDTSLANDKDTSFLKTHCWVCHVKLVSEDGEVCCYAMHTHPILNTPVCSVCYEIMEDAIRDHTACAGCGKETETSFLCDNIIQGLVCQNEFCFECVEKAGLDVSVLQASTAEWHCLACNPTRTLQALCTSDDVLPNISERTAEDILQELEVAEEKKRECEESLEDANLQLKSQDILLELQEIVFESELEEAVQEELEAWKELQIHHEARLGDFISKLQDELESRGIDLATVYHSSDYLSVPAPTLPEVSPQWVETADRVNAQRKEEEKAFPVKPTLPIEEYNKDYTDNIIEIAKTDTVSEIVGCRGSGWVKSVYKPTLGDFRVAQEEEDKERVRRKLSNNVTRRTDTGDRDIMKDEGPRIRNANGRMLVEPKKRRTSAAPNRPASMSGNYSRPGHATSSKEPNPLSPDSEIISVSELDGPFIGSDDILCTPRSCEAASLGLSSEGVVRKISIAKGFARILKGHQKDGVKFIWRNSFCDFEKNINGNENDERVGGCILAHHMGLGKTLTTIALLHTVLTSPSMVPQQNDEKLLRTVVLVVPVNTLANWKDEFTKWFAGVNPKVRVYMPSEKTMQDRKALISYWMEKGGILLVSSDTLKNLVEVKEEAGLLRASILVVDEAHTMVKNSSTQIFKVLSKFATKRRILLSGSPFQNNLLEFYHMCNFIRNGVFGVQSLFKEKFLTPISQGQTKDSTNRQKALTATLSDDLRKLVDAHIHRKDLSVLEKDLPKLSQVVIHVRPSHVQSKVYRSFDRARSANAELKNFFKMYSELSPVHNHPSCLLTKKYSDDASPNLWCRERLSSEAETAELGKITGGNKIVLLLHLLAFAQELGEKVLIFSQYLSTLNYIEDVLKSEDWISQVPSLSCFAGQRLGGWVKGQHYLRLDGTSSSTQRGQSINAFNEDGADGDLRAFLISSMAGCLGINLTSASRVVLVDSHFNPTVMTQAVFRAYRLGQQKPVHCYRLLTEGTMEEKIYARSVNKTGLALRLIDSQSITGIFSAKELEDFQQFDTWVQCDKCEKWRMLTGASADDLSEQWFCEMNTDHHNNSCDPPERDQAWYVNVYKNGFPASPQKPKAEAEQPTCQPEEDDELLSHLISVSESKKGTSLISRHYYHDSLLQSRHDGEEVEHARILLADEAAAEDLSNTESEVPRAANPVKTGQSLASHLAKETATMDQSSRESEISNVTNSIEFDRSVAPDLAASSDITRDEVSFSKKEKKESENAGGATELLNDIPVRQSLPSDPEIIDLCDSSDDDS